MPRTPRQSARLGVTLMSITGSSSPHRRGVALRRSAGPAGSSMMPSWSSLRPSSQPEHSMPFDATPRIVLAFSTRPLRGMTVPGGAKTPSMPARALGAPHTTWTSPAPVSTMQSRSLSALGCGSALTHARDEEGGQSAWRGSRSTSTSRPSMTSQRDDLVERRVGVEMGLEPGERRLHRASPRHQRRHIERQEAVMPQPAQIAVDRRCADRGCRISAWRCARSPCRRRSPDTRRDRCRNWPAPSDAPCREPRISSQSPPAPIFKPPPSREQPISTSAEGSVKGK